MKKTTEEYIPLPLQSLMPTGDYDAVAVVPDVHNRTLTPKYNPPSTMLEAVLKASMDPAADAAKVREFLAIALKLEDRDRETAYYRDMGLAQKEMEPVWRNKVNPDSKSRFADLEAVDRSIRPIYTKYGFSLTGTSAPPLVPTNVRVVIDCAHREGFHRPYELELAIDDVGIKGSRNKTAVQGGTSTVSYVRRTLECLIFNVVFSNEDKDGADPFNLPITEAHLKALAPALAILTEQELKDFLDWAGVEATEQILDRKYAECVAQLKPIWERKKAK